MGSRAVAALVVVLAVASLAAPAVATHTTDRKLTLTLDADGDAAATYRLTFDLNDSADERRFGRLETNDTARQQRLAAFGDTLAEGARIIRNQTGRNSTVRVQSATTTRFENGTGRVLLHARWTAVAATPRDWLVVTTPFSQGYRPPGRLGIVAPSGFVRDVTQPLPGVARYRSAVWSADQDTGGMYLRFVPEPSPTPAAASPPAGMGPFLGAVAIALVPALVVALSLATRG